MHNDGHSCFPRGSVENYADGKFLFLTIARLYRFIIMMLFPVQLDGEERIFRSLVKNDKIKPSRIEQIMVRNIFPENLRERDLFMQKGQAVSDLTFKLGIDMHNNIFILIFSQYLAAHFPV